MTAPLTFYELFAGAGGLSMGLERAGMRCVGHAEINKHARAVLRHRWPEVPLAGDVSRLSGADMPPIDLLTGGSPCQDLSIAGKRKGLAGERSSLFHQQARIWNESGAPYLLWENVPGALSSNNGADFAVVLGTLVGAPIPVPQDGWGSAGVAAGPTAVAAFRVLDLQHFGPPQRRARVFVLAARAGGVDPAEVLLEPEGVRWDLAPRREAGEGTAPRAGGRVAFALGSHAGAAEAEVSNQSHAGGGPAGFGITEEMSNSLRAGRVSSVVDILTFDNRPQVSGDGVDHTVTTEGERNPMSVLAFAQNQRGEVRVSDVSTSLTAGGGKPGEGYPAVLAFNNTGQGWWKESDTAASIRTPAGSGSLEATVVTVTGEVTHALTHEGADASEDGTGRGTPIVVAQDVARCDTAGEGARGDWETTTMVAQVGIPRRLTPRECERLMSWPDDHTRRGVDEQGGTYELKDTPRYQLCGNGVGSDCTAWIGERLVAAVAALRAAHPARTAGAA